MDTTRTDPALGPIETGAFGAALSEAWGGLAAMLVALPQAIAYGVVIYAALGPEHSAQGALAGILGAVSIGITAPLFGGAPRLVSGPCAPAAAVMAALAGTLAAASSPVASPAHIPLLLTLTGLLCGLLQLGYGAAGGGALIKFIPYPVVTGYLSGVAVLIFLGQIPKLLGLPAGAHVQDLVSPALWSGTALTVGLATMAVMVSVPKNLPVPAPILGLAGGLAAYWALAWVRPELRTLPGNALVIGPIGEGATSAFSGLFSRWSLLRELDLKALREILVPAMTLSVLLSIDTLKTCVVVDALTRSRHDSNRELRGQGLANLLSALAGGAPGAGTMGATLVNINSGGRTRFSGALAGVFALAAFLLLGRLMAWVPLSALAGILIVVAWNMYDRKSFRLLRRRSTLFDFAVGATVIVTAVTLDLIMAAGVGLGMSILLFIRDQIRGHVIRRKTYGDKMFSKQRRLPEETALLEERGGQTVVCELQGSLFFGTTDQLFTELEADLKTRRYVLLDMRRVVSVDFTAIHMLKQIEDHLHDRQGRLLLCSLPQSLPTGQDLAAYFNEVGLIKPTRNVDVFDSIDDALEWAEDRLLCEAAPRRDAGESVLGLREIDLMREFDDAMLEAMKGCIREESFEAGRMIFSKGDAGDELFLIRRGKVRILLPLEGGKTHHLATLGRGDFFGEVAFLDREERSASAAASTPVDVYAFSRTRFDELSRGRPDFGVRVFARLARALAIRLRQTDGELRALQEA